MTRPTVLVGFAEAQAAPEVVWSLVDEGFHVMAFARRGRGSALRHSRHAVCYEIQAPESNLEQALMDMRTLLDLLGSNAGGAPCILFPLDDKAVWLCSRVCPKPGWLLAGPSDGCAELALNKHLQMERARAAGFSVPKTVLAASASEIFRFAAVEAFPLFLKPAECVPVRNGRVYLCRKWVCIDISELERAMAEWAESVPLLVQPFLHGTGEGVFGLATPGGIRAWSAHRRVRMMNPQGSGSSACASAPVPDGLKPKVEALINNAGWRGLFMVELLRDHSGTVWFVELNGRPWGSMALARRQGLEYPSWHVRLSIDHNSPVQSAPVCPQQVVCRNVGREIMHLLFLLRGARSKALNNSPAFWRTVADIIRIRRGDALYNWRRDDSKVFIADCYYTIWGNLFKPGR